MTELEQLQYNDVMADLASIIDTNGARAFLMDFKENYPMHFNELYLVCTGQARQVPKLFQNYNAPSV